MSPPPNPTPIPTQDVIEVLRQAFAGLLPGDPLSTYLDRMEGRR